MLGITEHLIKGKNIWPVNISSQFEVYLFIHLTGSFEIQFVNFLSYRSSLGKKPKNILPRPRP